LATVLFVLRRGWFLAMPILVSINCNVASCFKDILKEKSYFESSVLASKFYTYILKPLLILDDINCPNVK
jgi:hypothetical protein